jgi:hypothetical protein
VPATMNMDTWKKLKTTEQSIYWCNGSLIWNEPIKSGCNRPVLPLMKVNEAIGLACLRLVLQSCNRPAIRKRLPCPTSWWYRPGFAKLVYLTVKLCQVVYRFQINEQLLQLHVGGLKLGWVHTLLPFLQKEMICRSFWCLSKICILLHNCQIFSIIMTIWTLFA